MISGGSTTNKPKNVRSLGSYNEIGLFFLPGSARLVRLCNIFPTDNGLDVACGTGNTAITAKMLSRGAKVTGVDITPELLIIAGEEASLAEAEDIEWKEGNVEALPFEDETFDVVLSIFGHIFTLNPEVAIQEMLRVTKSEGRIAFATWPPELANGRLFETMAKYIPFSSVVHDQSPPSPPSPMLWGIPEVVQKRLCNSVKNIHFERGAVNEPVLSLNHWWKISITKSGSLIHVIQSLKDAQKIESLKNDILQAIAPNICENVLKLDYLITKAIKS